jgi:hypothetical protein
MSKKTKPSRIADEMRPEYDFSHGVRGKHSRDYRQGHTVKINRTDGMTLVQHFTLEQGAVILAEDVREYFPDSDSVNQALRMLIRLIPKKPPRTSKSGRR